MVNSNISWTRFCTLSNRSRMWNSLIEKRKNIRNYLLPFETKFYLNERLFSGKVKHTILQILDTGWTTAPDQIFLIDSFLGTILRIKFGKAIDQRAVWTVGKWVSTVLELVTLRPDIVYVCRYWLARNSILEKTQLKSEQKNAKLHFFKLQHSNQRNAT